MKGGDLLWISFMLYLVAFPFVVYHRLGTDTKTSKSIRLAGAIAILCLSMRGFFTIAALTAQHPFINTLPMMGFSILFPCMCAAMLVQIIRDTIDPAWLAHKKIRILSVAVFGAAFVFLFFYSRLTFPLRWA
jgi:hypothetical protein